MSERFAIVWADTARNDLLAIIDYLVDRDGVDAAEAVYDKIVDGVRGLETMLRRCRIVPNSKPRASRPTASFSSVPIV